jgi:hypothetical protein
MRALAFASVLAALLVGGASASAQSANASVTAEVQQPITVTKTRDLDFGLVFPGVDKVVAVSDATSAAFSVTGQASAQVHITFTLPGTLTNGGNSLTITDWTARHNTTNSSASGTDFTPSASPTTATLSGSGELYVFLGATVQPTTTQVAGTYTGTATITVVYF